MNELFNEEDAFKTGQSVRLKAGVMDETNPERCLAGYQGEILDIVKDEQGRPWLELAWDSVTLRNLPMDEIQEAKENGEDWTRYIIGPDEVEAAPTRETEEDLDEVIREKEEEFYNSLLMPPTPDGKGREFDIFSLEKSNLQGDPQLWALYKDSLIDAFLDSQEGLAHREQNPETGFWIEKFLDFGYEELKCLLTEMEWEEVEDIMKDIFPRREALIEEEAEDIVSELLAFWHFLKRQYNLPEAEKIIEYLRDFEDDYAPIILESSEFELAESLLLRMAMVEEGFSPGSSNEEEFRDLLLAYHRRLLERGLSRLKMLDLEAGEADDLFFLSGDQSLDSEEYSSALSSKRSSRASPEQRKKKRKQAKTARKQNRKRKKK